MQFNVPLVKPKFAEKQGVCKRNKLHKLNEVPSEHQSKHIVVHRHRKLHGVIRGFGYVGCTPPANIAIADHNTIQGQGLLALEANQTVQAVFEHRFSSMDPPTQMSRSSTMMYYTLHTGSHCLPLLFSTPTHIPHLLLFENEVLTPD
jgi:hypothetical protein